MFRALTVLGLALVVFLAPAGAAPAFRVALGPDPGPLDWSSGPPRDRSLLPLVLALSDSLVTLDPVTGAPTPGLAKAWTVADGGRTWVFTLKPAHWSDGTALDAAAVVEAWRRNRAPGTASAPAAATVKIVLAEPAAGAGVFALPPYLVAAADPAVRSSGPFQFEARSPGESIAVSSNPQYRDAKTVKLGRVVFRLFLDPAEPDLWWRKGLVDWVPSGWGPGTWSSATGRAVSVSPAWGSIFLRLNTARGVLQGLEFRRSLADTLDRGTLVAGLRGPRLLPTDSLVPSLLVTTPPKRPWKPVFGPQNQAGTLTLLFPTGEVYRALAEGLVRQWAPISGLTIELKETSGPEAQTLRRQGAYDLALSAWVGDDPDPASFLELGRSAGPWNQTGFSDPAFDQTLDRLRALPPGPERTKAALEAEARLEAGGAFVPLASYAAVNRIDLSRWAGWSANVFDVHPWTGIRPKK